MSWVFASTEFASDITLPIAPKNAVYKSSADIKEYKIPGGLPLLISFSNKPFVLSLEGIFYNAASFASTMDALYIIPFYHALYKAITITDPNGMFSGDWIFTSFELTEDSFGNKFKYKMEFVQGSNASGTAPGIVI